jgi:small subunit ribosomal protein S17
MPKRVLTGTVVSDKGDKTIVVRVERRVKHPLYGKIIRLSKKYHAHDEANAFKLGQQVRIEECKPMSKLKSWTVLDSLGAAPVAVDEIAEVDVSKPIKAAPAPTPSKASKAKANADASETAEA